jgi:hypothetical protein
MKTYDFKVILEPEGMLYLVLPFLDAIVRATL